VREAGRREKGEERERASGDRAKKRGGGWETGCLQLSCGSAAAEPPASAVPTRIYVEREQIDGCTSSFHQVSCLFSFVGSCVPCWRR
jgi:hypothetical protein